MVEVKDSTSASLSAETSAPVEKESPILKLGLILSNVAAGMRGQPLPSQQYERQKQEKRALEIREIQATMGLVKEGVTLFDGMENRDESPEYAAFLAKAEKALPGFGGVMNLALSHKKEDVLAGHEHASRIYAICGRDRDCFQKVMTNASLISQFDAVADRDRLPGIVKKFQSIAAAVGGDEELKKLNGDGKWTLSDLTLLPEGFRFTDEEIRTIQRNQDIQNSLIEFGFEPTEIAGKVAETTATERAKQNIKPKERKIVKAADGFNYYEDTGERVFPNVQKKEDESALVEKVSLLEGIGIPTDVAVKTAAGVYRAATDAFGRSTIVDPTTGTTVWPKEEGGRPAPAGEAATPQTGAEATGGQAVLQGLVNKVTDFFGAGLQFEDTQTAVDNLNAMSATTLLGLSTSMATRDTNMVRGIIRDLLPEAGTLKMGDDASLSKIKALRDQLQIMYDDEKNVLDNKSDYPPQMIRAATASTKNLKRLLDMWSGVIDNWNKKPEERKSDGPKYKEGDKAVNRKTGEQIIFRNGKWEKL